MVSLVLGGILTHYDAPSVYMLLALVSPVITIYVLSYIYPDSEENSEQEQNKQSRNYSEHEKKSELFEIKACQNCGMPNRICRNPQSNKVGNPRCGICGEDLTIEKEKPKTTEQQEKKSRKKDFESDNNSYRMKKEFQKAYENNDKVKINYESDNDAYRYKPEFKNVYENPCSGAFDQKIDDEKPIEEYILQNENKKLLSQFKLVIKDPRARERYMAREREKNPSRSDEEHMRNILEQIRRDRS